MHMILFSMLLQASFIVSPAPVAAREDVEQVASLLMRNPTVHGTLSKPAIVPTGEIWTPERLISLHKEAEVEMRETAARATAPSITRDIDSGCRKLSEHPRGFQLEKKDLLNGRSTLYRCNDFLAEVIGEDFSSRLTVLTGTGFSPLATDAYLNGGALMRNFRISGDGVKQLVYVWIGNKMAYTVVLTTRQSDFQSLQIHGDRILNALTENIAISWHLTR